MRDLEKSIYLEAYYELHMALGHLNNSLNMLPNYQTKKLNELKECYGEINLIMEQVKELSNYGQKN